MPVIEPLKQVKSINASNSVNKALGGMFVPMVQPAILAA